MSKERLKEIQEKYDMWSNDFNLDPQEIEWLIEQTGRAIKNAEDLHVMDLQLASEQKQNKRYRESIKRAISILKHMSIDKGTPKKHAIEVLSEALKGE